MEWALETLQAHLVSHVSDMALGMAVSVGWSVGPSLLARLK